MEKTLGENVKLDAPALYAQPTLPCGYEKLFIAAKLDSEPGGFVGNQGWVLRFAGLGRTNDPARQIFADGICSDPDQFEKPEDIAMIGDVDFAIRFAGRD